MNNAVGTAHAVRGRPPTLAGFCGLAVADLLVASVCQAAGLSLSQSLNLGFAGAGIFAVFRVLGIGRSATEAHPARQFAVLFVAGIPCYFARLGAAGLLMDVWHLVPAGGLALVVGATAAMIEFSIGLARRPDWMTMDDAGELRYWAFGIAGISILLRVLYAAQIELLPEEAYYWNYSRHPDFSYLDHPPMVAWLIWAGTHALGENELGVRAGALVCGALATLFSYRLTRHLFGGVAAIFALVLMQTLPFLFLSGILMTPDSPLTAAWAALLYCLERALLAGRAQAWAWAGVALGVGLLSKYTIALPALATFLFVLTDAPSRRWLARREPYVAVLIAAALFAPVLFWNFQNGWASFAFQTSRRLAEPPRFALHKLIGSMFVLIAPVGVLTVLSVLRARPTVGAAPGHDPDSRWRLILWWVATPLAVFTLFSLRHEVKVDWTGAPWVGAVPAMAAAIHGWRRAVPHDRPNRLLAAWPLTIAGLLVAYSTGFGYLVFGLPAVGYSTHMELAPVGWRELGRQIAVLARDVEAAQPARVLIVGADRYETASELAFYSADIQQSVRRTSAGHLIGGVGLMYERWFPRAQQAGATLLLVSWQRADLSLPRVEERFREIGPVHEVPLTHDGRNVRSYFYRVGRDYGAAPGAAALPAP